MAELTLHLGNIGFSNISFALHRYPAYSVEVNKLENSSNSKGSSTNQRRVDPINRIERIERQNTRMECI